MFEDGGISDSFILTIIHDMKKVIAFRAKKAVGVTSLEITCVHTARNTLCVYVWTVQDSSAWRKS
jgi:hypothetical protein